MGKEKEQLAFELFQGARRKIKRANQHIHELNRIFDSFLDSDFYRFVSKRDADTNESVLEYCVDPMPEEVPLILGDALHNLRTSLDFVATEIKSRAGQGTDHSNFPIRDSEEKAKAAINGGFKEAAPASVISVILNEIKPYKRGNDALWALHTLDMTDKHFLIIPTVSIATIRDVDLAFGELRMYNCTVIVESGQKIRWIAGPAGGPDINVQLKNKGELTCNIVFTDNELVRMQPVIPTLHQFSKVVSGSVDAIAKAYLASV